MSIEHRAAAAVEVVPQTPNRKNRYRPRKLAAVLLGGVALLASGHHANADKAKRLPAHNQGRVLTEASPMDFVVISGNDSFTNDLPAAEAADRQVAAFGANTVRIFLPDFAGQKAVGTYQTALCNAAHAAYDNDLKLIINLEGQPLGYMPESADDVRSVAMYGDNIIRTLVARSTRKNPAGGCEQDQKDVYIEGENEPNNPTFNTDQSPLSPQSYMYMMSRLYAAVKAQATMPDTAADVTVIGGSLSAANNNPIGYLNAMLQAEGPLGLTQPPFDDLDVHPYPTSVLTDPSVTMNMLYPQIKADFPNTPLGWLEMGVPQSPTGVKQGEYNPAVPSGLVNEGQQAQFMCDAISAAASELGVVGVGNFHLQDNSGDGSINTGVKYPDGSRKPAYWALSPNFQQAAQGRPIVCAPNSSN